MSLQQLLAFILRENKRRACTRKNNRNIILPAKFRRRSSERLELNSVCPGFLSSFSRDAKIEAIFRLIYQLRYMYRIRGFPITRSPFKPRVASTSSATESVRSTLVKP